MSSSVAAVAIFGIVALLILAFLGHEYIIAMGHSHGKWCDSLYQAIAQKVIAKHSVHSEILSNYFSNCGP